MNEKIWNGKIEMKFWEKLGECLNSFESRRILLLGYINVKVGGGME